MEKITSFVSIVTLLIIFASVVDHVRATICIDGLGSCETCDERCKTKHGPTGEGSCDHSVGMPLCRCYYQCLSAPPAPPAPKMCNGNGGVCSESCPDTCCDMNCAQKFTGGHGVCNTLGTYKLCQCSYPC